MGLIFLVTEDWYFVSHLPLAIAAKEVGFEVTVVTRCRENRDEVRAAGIEVIPFKMTCFFDRETKMR